MQLDSRQDQGKTKSKLYLKLSTKTPKQTKQGRKNKVATKQQTTMCKEQTGAETGAGT